MADYQSTSHRAAPGRPFLTLLRYNQQYWPEYLGGATLAFAYMGGELCMPMIIRAVVGRFETGTMTSNFLMAYFCFLVLISIVSGISRYWERILIIGASRKFEFDLRNDYYRHIQSLSQDFFHRTKTGDIMARATNDLNYVRMFIGPGVMGTVDMIRIPITLGMMLYLCPSLTLVSLIPLPFVSILVYSFVMYMHHQSKKVQDQFSHVSSRAQENLAGARVVKAYGIADREQRDFLRESLVYMRESIKLNVVMALAHPLIGLVIGGITLSILWYGGSMVIADTLSLGDFAGFIVYLLMLAWPLAQFGWVLTLYQRGAVSMNRITDILAEVPTIRDGDVRTDVAAIEGDVDFRNVSFAYNGRLVLEDVSFSIPRGSTAAIVGPTGSGKSTIVSLITREYDPVSGRVLIDGTEATALPLRVLRGSIGYVPQDTFVFSATIRENLVFGRPDATQAQIESAAEVAQFDEAIALLSEGYETLLGERGVNLSGGQKQRLAIARAVVRDPRILILDDSLSSVDTHTEEEILQRLHKVMASRTSIIISHRVSTVRHADQIIVIDQGCVAERGSHEELVASGGLYADMYARQLLADELEEEA